MYDRTIVEIRIAVSANIVREFVQRPCRRVVEWTLAKRQRLGQPGAGGVLECTESPECYIYPSQSHSRPDRTVDERTDVRSPFGSNQSGSRR